MQRVSISRKIRRQSVCWCVAYCVIGFSFLSSGLCAAPDALSICDILERVQHRYEAADFEADFFQESYLKAMGVVDAAQGHVCFRPPAMMRWHYKTPEDYLIITDGQTVWVYRPTENQVLVGKAAEYFGDMKWTEFFTKPGALLENFAVQWAPPEAQAKNRFVLKLLPKTSRPNLTQILLFISKSTFDIVRSDTYNAFGDKTTLRFKNFRFNQGLDPSLFRFKPPEGADVLQLEGDKG